MWGAQKKKCWVLRKQERYILGMLIEIGGANQVQFKLPENYKEVIDGNTGRSNDEMMDG